MHYVHYVHYELLIAITSIMSIMCHYHKKWPARKTEIFQCLQYQEIRSHSWLWKKTHISFFLLLFVSFHFSSFILFKNQILVVQIHFICSISLFLFSLCRTVTNLLYFTLWQTNKWNLAIIHSMKTYNKNKRRIYKTQMKKYLSMAEVQ